MHVKKKAEMREDVVPEEEMPREVVAPNRSMEVCDIRAKGVPTMVADEVDM
jgi:hypothetical protein